MPDSPTFNLEAFRQFEHAGWNEVASRYQATFGRLTAQAVDSLLDAADVRGGVRVLDLACGTGLHAHAALQRGAVATGIDLSEAMVEQAKLATPGAHFHVGDAEPLPFDDESFDAVVCGFGVLHFPDADKAVAQTKQWRKHSVYSYRTASSPARRGAPRVTRRFYLYSVMRWIPMAVARSMCRPDRRPTSMV